MMRLACAKLDSMCCFAVCEDASENIAASSTPQHSTETAWSRTGESTVAASPRSAHDTATLGRGRPTQWDPTVGWVRCERPGRKQSQQPTVWTWE